MSAGVPFAASAEFSELEMGWMVAKAGAATPIINAMTNATVTSKTMRFIVSATSLYTVRQPVALLAPRAPSVPNYSGTRFGAAARFIGQAVYGMEG